ncbi:protein of unknown function [Nonomuraea solani]|uniref:DUF4158 domain-containing protein n=1 Tax=Nonomuraea solani TaxID=1144553 RepID=A0A1H6EGX5_9ACTN|nr:DUF4158 domain-containing protein [Nonomuraea solani]SEG96064.1 protein of unknown function [Nonomuraea solani]
MRSRLAGKVRAHVWNAGDGPTALFQYAVRRLRHHDVLLPGISTLTRLVARERELHDTLVGLLSMQQRSVLELLLKVPPRKKVSDLERWRTGPSKASWPQIVKSLDLAAEIGGAGLGRLELDATVPQRRLDEPARYGLTAHSRQVKKHPASRRLATLPAMAQRREAKTIDDTLQLLMVPSRSARRSGRSSSIPGRPRPRPGWRRRWRCCWRPRGGARTYGCSRCGR